MIVKNLTNANIYVCFKETFVEAESSIVLPNSSEIFTIDEDEELAIENVTVKALANGQVEIRCLEYSKISNDITEDLEKIKNAHYGKEVRKAIHDSIYNVSRLYNEFISTLELLNQITQSADGKIDLMEDMYQDALEKSETLAEDISDYSTTFEQIVSQLTLPNTNLGIVIDTYSNQKTYFARDLVSKNGYIWKALVDIPVAEEWTEAHWQKVTVLEKLQEYLEFYRNFKSSFSDVFDTTKNYTKNQYCTNNDILYKANEDIAAGPWNPTQWTATTITNELENRLDFEVSEIRVGTWRDGKPLYMKTYNAYTERTSGSDVLYFFEDATNFAKNIDIKNREYSAKIEYLSSGNYLKAYNGNNGIIGDFYFGNNVSDGNIYVGRTNFNSNYNVRSIEATIYYTKVTD